MHTLATLIDRHGVDVLDHLDRDVTVPVLTGLQFQGDVAVIPTVHPVHKAAQPVPAAGVPVVRGESGGNTHLLIADGDGVTWAAAPDRRDPAALDLGTLTVPEGAAAYLAHPEHAYAGIGAGVYTVRRQREQAEAVRLVAD